MDSRWGWEGLDGQEGSAEIKEKAPELSRLRPWPGGSKWPHGTRAVSVWKTTGSREPASCLINAPGRG